MIIEELQVAYPGAPNAASICECLQCWEAYRMIAQLHGIHALKEYMRRSITKTIAESTDPMKTFVLGEALAQWDHSDFHRYLAAKVGAV